MPTYGYRCSKCGHCFDRTVPMDDRNKAQACNCGAVAERDMAAEQQRHHDNPDLWRRGLESTALGVHPDQVPAERARLKKLTGHDIEFSRDGDPILRSRGQRRAVMKAIGYHDRDGGYGD